MDIKSTAEDSFIGKYTNSYDNKVLLCTAINGYFASITADGLLDNMVDNTVTIDMAAQKAYLTSIGINISTMTDQQIKEANTADNVFLVASIKPLDAIESISLNITI
jgi:hypothetical protein